MEFGFIGEKDRYFQAEICHAEDKQLALLPEDICRKDEVMFWLMLLGFECPS